MRFALNAWILCSVIALLSRLAAGFEGTELDFPGSGSLADEASDGGSSATSVPEILFRLFEIFGSAALGAFVG